MVTEPPPADALGQDEAHFLAAITTLQTHFKYSFQTRAARVKRFALQPSVELLRMRARDHARAGVAAMAEIFIQSRFHRLRVEQPLLVPLLRRKRHDEILRQRLEPVTLRPMS